MDRTTVWALECLGNRGFHVRHLRMVEDMPKPLIGWADIRAAVVAQHPHRIIIFNR